MQNVLVWTTFLAAALAFGATGCGDDTGSSGTGGTGAAGGSGGAGGTGGSTSTGTVDLLNGCDAATAEDHTADATTTVTTAGLTFTPACITIATGASVKFTSSSFAVHPLFGGEIDGTVKTPDATSPIAATTTGTEVTFAFPAAGIFPYYCDEHGPGGMAGVVYVVAP